MKICLAGTYAATKNTRRYLDITRFILESFYYIQDWQLEYLKKKELFLLDSGAFTFMSNNKGEVNWKEYIDRYADFIIKNDVKYFFELDIDVLVGYDKVKELTKYLENKTGRKCIPVWHKSRGIEEWKRLVKEYDYVAIGGIVVKEIKNVFSHCEHHLALMYNMTVTVAYLPVKLDEHKYKVIGLSKIPRIVELCAKRLQLQEQLANDIAECISLATGSGDVYVNIVADHACVAARGAKSDGFTDVTAIRGLFETNIALREEVERKVRH